MADLVEREGFGGAATVELPVEVVEILAGPVAQQHRIAHPTVHLLFLLVGLFEDREVS